MLPTGNFLKGLLISERKSPHSLDSAPFPFRVLLNGLLEVLLVWAPLHCRSSVKEASVTGSVKLAGDLYP